MKFTHARSEVTVKRTANIIDGPKIPHPESSVRGKEVELVRVSITYVFVNGEWKAPAGGIVAEGWTLTKEGKRSQRKWTGLLGASPDRTEGGWLRKLIDGMRPTGRAELPFDVTEA